MNATGEAVAAAALELVGARFRLHGRDPTNGLDCVGLVEASLAGAGIAWRAPTAYALRNSRMEDMLAVLGETPAQRIAASATSRPGDIVLCAVGPAQHHLLVGGPALPARPDFIHAHAGLRRVVRLPAPPDWPAVARWRPA